MSLPTTIGPAKIPGYPSDASIAGWGNIGDIVSRALTYVFPIAGILVFIYLLYGGLNLMLAAGNEEGLREGKAKITNAIIGFLIIFAAFWLVQALEIVFDITLLNWGASFF
jgi:hypothetical protein